MTVFRKRNKDGTDTIVHIEGDVHGDVIIGDHITVVKDSVVQRSSIGNHTEIPEPEWEEEWEPECEEDAILADIAREEAVIDPPTNYYQDRERYATYLNAISTLGPPNEQYQKHQRAVARIREAARQCRDIPHKDRIQRMLCVITANRALKGTFPSNDDEDEWHDQDYGPPA